MSAEIHNFPADRITRPLVFDALSQDDGAILIEDSADKSWRDRCVGINNLVVQATEAWGNRLVIEGGTERTGGMKRPKDFDELVDTTLLALHLAAAYMVEGSQEEAPACQDAARLFGLSIKRKHRDAARVYMGSHRKLRDLIRGSDLRGLQILWNMTETFWPGLEAVQLEALRRYE